MMFKRIFTIVIDSVGAGAAPDAAKFDDLGANTLKHISEAFENGLVMPNLEAMGLGLITDIKGLSNSVKPAAYVAKMEEISNGKDTMTGHWEFMGLEITKPFKTFTDTGFPQALLDELSLKTGRGIVGNIAASGTEIIKQYGMHQIETGDLIVYTSADSVLQIAAHEEVIALDELYKICEIAREITLRDEYKVGRIIARPYVGDSPETFKRTPNRHDYALKPFDRTVLDELKDHNYDVISVGKISDIYDGEGITESNKIKSNHHGMEITTEIAKRDFNGLCFVNLVDFDALYGHRRNPVGYGESLMEFDRDLGTLLPLLKEDDLLIITADHGNDPIHHGTDHTREYVPLVVYNKNFKEQKHLGILKSFASLGATIADNFNVKLPSIGASFLKQLK